MPRYNSVLISGYNRYSVVSSVDSNEVRNEVSNANYEDFLGSQLGSPQPARSTSNASSEDYALLFTR